MIDSRYFSTLLLVMIGACGSSVGCGASTDSGPSTPSGGGGAPQTGSSGGGSTNVGGGSNAGGAQIGAGGSGNTNIGVGGGSNAGGAQIGAGGGSNDGGRDSTIEGTGGMQADGGGGGTASSGGARNDGGSIDAGSACEQAAAVDRTCTAVTDCVVVNHQTDYIGQMRLLGIRSSAMARFADLEKSCQATIKTFHLPGTTADDGSLVDASSKAVTCASGLCTTFSQACGQPCAPDHICITCGTGATLKSVCSQDCTMTACTEAPRTSCLGGTSVNGGEGEFCFDPMFASGFMSSSCHR